MSRNHVAYNGDLFTAADYEKFAAEFPEEDEVMMGRGLVANPGLVREICDGKRMKKEELVKFHEMIYGEYGSLLSGDRNILFRMKELWGYMLPLFSDSSRYGKKIKKAEKLAVYEAAVKELFSNCPFKWEE